MDVFLSYASEDRGRARQVAQALEGCGWSVWWDRKIVAGEAFDQTIERQLDSARCVVVLWSTASVASEWVKNEAAAAAERQVLVPVLVDDVKIPLEFRRRQTANLLDWDGDTSHEGFHALREGVAARVGASPQQPPVPQPPVPRPGRQFPLWAILAGGIAVVIVAIAIVRGVGTSPRDASSDQVRQSSDSVASPTRAGEPPPEPSSRGAEGPELTVAQSKVVPAPDGNSVDNPAPLAFGALHKVRLEKNESYYFRLPTPVSAFTIVQDVRLPTRESSNLMTDVSILDTDGGVVQPGAVRFNQIDVGYRKTASFSTKQPARFGFKLVNTAQSSDVWFAVLPEGKEQFLPFFGEIVPQPFPSGKDATGTLEKFEDVYYQVRLPRGEHRAILDFTNAKKDHTNLVGYLAVLTADGGNQEQIMRMNQIGTTYRQIGNLQVKTDGPLILRLQNSSPTVNYNLRIVSAK